jgi:hypothetical protein
MTVDAADERHGYNWAEILRFTAKKQANLRKQHHLKRRHPNPVSLVVLTKQLLALTNLLHGSVLKV